MRWSLLHAAAATAASAMVMTAAAITGADTNVDTGNPTWMGLILVTWLWVFIAWAVVVVIALVGFVRRLARGGNR